MRTVVVACVLAGILSPFTSGQTLTTRHYDEVVPLVPDTTGIVVLPVAPDVDMHAALDALGIPAGRREELTLAGAVRLDVPVGTDAWEHAAAVRVASPELFTSPVFVDEFGGPMYPTPTLLLRFTAGTPRSAQQVIVDGLVTGAGATVVDGPAWAGMSGAWKLALDSRDGDAVIALANALSDRDDVRIASPDWVATVRKNQIPTDPLFGSSWGLHNTGQTGGIPDNDMDAPEAWDITMGDPSVVVLVMDDGAQLDHPDLNMGPGEDFVGEGGGGGPVNVCDEHGTAVSGCISGIANNGLGTTGVAPSCLVASARVASSDVPCTGGASTFMSSIPDALAWGDSNGARISNLSFTWPNWAVVSDAYDAWHDAGMVHFSNTGNQGAGLIDYPSLLGSVNGIGASTDTGSAASFSNNGIGLAFLAPGQGILTTDRTGSEGFGSGDYVTVNGTSFSSPFAAGVAALALSHSPHLMPAQLEQVLYDSCVDKGAPGYDTVHGYGVVNAAAVLQQLEELQPITYIKPSNTDPGDRFGESVAIWEDLLVVGSLLEDSNVPGVNGDGDNNAAMDPGAAYILERLPNRWVQRAYLKASNTGSSDRFGMDVAVFDATVAVAARYEDTGGNNAGAAYIFDRSGGVWSETAFILPNVSGAMDEFGTSLSLHEDTLVVGAPREDSSAAGVGGDPSDNSLGNAGAVYVFVRDGGTWQQQAYIKASNPGAGDEFGKCVSVWGDTLVVGAPYEASDADGIGGNQGDDTATDAGAAYVFSRTGSTWTQEAYLKAGESKSGDEFGFHVAVALDRVIVGAPGESGSGVGIDPPVDEAAPGAGAAYVFHRTGTTWSQEAYLKASNTDAGDAFGTSVALSDTRAAVGATGEASDAVGVGGDDTDDSMPGAGAVYAYGRTGSTWSATDYVKASAGDADDEFGFRVALSEDTLLVGARFEDGGDTFGGNPLNNTAAEAGAAYAYELDPFVPVDPWTDLGGGSVGIAGQPTLAGSGTLAGGTTAGLALTQAPPSAAMLAWISFAPTPFPALGGTVHAFPYASQLFLFANAGGSFSASTTWPAGIPMGTNVSFQFIVQDLSVPDGLTLSNGLRGTTP